MERRAIIAFALSAVLLVLYIWLQEQYFSAPPRPAGPPSAGSAGPAPPGAQAPTEATRPSGPAVPHAGSAPPGAAPALPGAAPALPSTAQQPPVAARSTSAAAETSARPRPPQRTATVDGPLYRSVVSSEGGKLQEWTLHYRGDKPMVVVGEIGPAGLVVAGPDGKARAPLPMTLTPEAVVLDTTRPAQEMVLNGEEGGLHFRETLGFRAGEFAVDIVVRIENTTVSPRSVSVALPWNARQHWGAGTEAFIGQRPTEMVWSTKGDIGRVGVAAAMPPLEMDGEWIGMDSVWYLAALVPRTAGWRLAASAEDKPAGAKNGGADPEHLGRATIEARATPTIDPGQSWEGRVLMYIGPKEYERLRALDLDRTLNFGGFPIPRRFGGLPMEWLGVPILLLMKWVYRYVGNYGIAIILLTVVTRVVFYPLTVKSMRSMKAMQALQPQINTLKAKYKNDPQRLQRETLELYRQHKVNPMGGCLPMIAQIPIFYALYLALSVSVELQSASFLCFGRLFGVDVWICDLARQDPTYVLPILMGITMFAQQKMTPTTADPRQAKAMLVMPFVFTFMFLNLPSGLVLYWTVSNVLQIVQQWYMNRPHAGAARPVKSAGRA
jgi:YidC/Oxa1 family membrane protein insertase